MEKLNIEFTNIMIFRINNNKLSYLREYNLKIQNMFNIYKIFIKMSKNYTKNLKKIIKMNKIKIRIQIKKQKTVIIKI